MWELIRSNKRKSTVLIIMMGLLLLVMGYVIGEALIPGAGPIGALAGSVLCIIMALASYFQGDSILLMSSRAHEIERDDYPRLFNVVEEMKIAAGLPKIPKVYIIDEMAPNAFATGRNEERAAVAVTAGLLNQLNRDELQGVIAHEIGHIKNRDILFITMAGVMVGSIVMISEGFLRAMWYGGHRGARYRSSRKGGGQAQGVLIIVAIVLAVLAPLIARLLYFAISRKREYLADATATQLTRYPEGLASALEKIASDRNSLSVANRATAPMYIINPLHKAGLKANNLTSTHPPITERVAILRGMVHGASLRDYQRAWRGITGKKQGPVPVGSLKKAESASIREAHPEPAPTSKKQQAREVGDLLRKVNQFAFLACVCGLRIKVPPDFKHPHISCPRCGKTNEIPVIQLAAAMAAVTALDKKPETTPPAEAKPLRYKRKGKGWESFKCTCDRTITLSPAFALSQYRCPDCERDIEIVEA